MEIHISRSEQKRRIKQLEELVEELTMLPEALLAVLPCSSDVVGMLKDTRGMKGGARKRQVKYITKVLKNDFPDMDVLYAFMSEKKGAALQVKKEFHEIEYLRDALMNEAIEQLKTARENHVQMEEDWPSDVVAEISRQFPNVDTGLLKQLAWLFARTRNRRHSREIFRLLRAAMEQKRFADKQNTST